MLLALSIPASFAVVLVNWSIEVAGSACEDSVSTESQYSPGIHEKNTELIRCSEEKARVTELLLAGKLTLPQAIEEFRRLNEHLEEVCPASTHFPNFHSDEALLESVLSWATSLAAFRPDQTAVLHRLEQERQQFFPKHGPVHAALH